MGWCHEFGVQICPDCSEPMAADTATCVCEHCGTTCTGRFTGCPDVWARGRRPVQLVNGSPVLAVRPSAVGAARQRHLARTDEDAPPVLGPDVAALDLDTAEVLTPPGGQVPVAWAGRMPVAEPPIGGGDDGPDPPVEELRYAVAELQARIDRTEARVETPPMVTSLGAQVTALQDALAMCGTRLDTLEEPGGVPEAFRTDLDRMAGEIGVWVTERLRSMEARVVAMEGGLHPVQSLSSDVHRLTTHQDKAGERTTGQVLALEVRIGAVEEATGDLQALRGRLDSLGGQVANHDHDGLSVLSRQLGEVDARLGALAERLHPTEARLGGLDAGLVALDARLDAGLVALGGRLDEVCARLGPVEARLGPIETRGARLEDLRRPLERVADLYEGGEWAPERVARIEEAVRRLLDAFDVVNADLSRYRADVAALSEALGRSNGAAPSQDG